MKNFIIVFFVFMVGVLFFAWHLSNQKEQARVRKKQSIKRFMVEPVKENLRSPQKPEELHDELKEEE